MMLENAVTVDVEKQAQEMLGFLNAEIARRQAPILLYLANAVIRGRQLKVPAYVSGDGDAYDKATLLQGLEDTWKRPRPRTCFISESHTYLFAPQWGTTSVTAVRKQESK